MSDAPAAEAAPKKKGKMKMIVIGAVGVIVLLGGGVGAGLYAAGSGMVGGGGAEKAAAHEDPNKPKLVPKSEQKHAGEGGDGAMAPLDDRVGISEGRNPRPVARRPFRAAEPGVRGAHDGADHDQEVGHGHGGGGKRREAGHPAQV